MNLIITILAWSWILLGVWWFFRPAGIRRRFEKRYRKYARWILVVVFFAVAGVAWSAGRSFGGVIGTVLGVVAVIALLKGLLFLTGKASDTVLDFWGKQSDTTYRIAAAALFVLGCLMHWMMHVAN